MKSVHKTLCFWLLFVLAFTFLEAQQTGEIRGKVTEESGEGLPGVAITAKSPNLQGLRIAVSEKDGNFRLPLLPVGIYALIFEITGFEKLTLAGQDVRLGFTTSLKIMLKPAAIQSEITVTAVNPLIDRTNADTSYRLRGDELTRLPTQAKTIAELVGFTPGVTGVRVNTVTGGAISWAGSESGLPGFRGEGDAGNNWLVDGLSVKGAMHGDPGVRVNYDAWEEVQIISEGFAPDLGQALGGFINIVTKSGGNSFHGELGGLIRNENLRAHRRDQLSVASLPDTSLGQYFGNLGGPIFKDKLWFFGSDNIFNSNDKTTEQSIGWLTIPAGERRVLTNNIYGKITYSPHIGHTLSLSGTWDKSLHQTGGIGVPECFVRQSYSDYLYRLNYRGILSPTLFLTAAWGESRRKSHREPLSGDLGPPQYVWVDIAQETNNTFSESSDQSRRDFVFSVSKFADLGRWGRHEIKAGFGHYGYESKRVVKFPGTDFDLWPENVWNNGVMIYWAGPGSPMQLFEAGSSAPGDSAKGYSAYLEDSFSLGRLSIMLGLRSETEKTYNDTGRLIWSWGFEDFLQPRVSLALDLAGNGRNVIKLGYGKFANPLSTYALQWFNQHAFGYAIYDWVGGEDPDQAQLKDPDNWVFSFGMSPEQASDELDPHLKPNSTHRFLLEFDRQINPHWALKLRGVFSYARKLTEDIAYYDPETQWVKWLFTNFEHKKRDYRALELEIQGRVTGRFMLNASYTWSQAKGSVPGNFTEGGTWSPGTFGGGADASFFGKHADIPDDSPNKELLDSLYGGLGGREAGDEGWYGSLPYSVDHQVKALATYAAPYGLVLASSLEYLSGYHWEKKGWVGVGDYLAFIEGRGVRQTPPHMYVDISVEKEFVLRKGPRFGVGINAYNIFNSQRPVSFVREDTELFGQVWARQLPRWVQLKCLLRF